jgi:rhodanese-related sulfurtransferase/peroxiredoxin
MPKVTRWFCLILLATVLLATGGPARADERPSWWERAARAADESGYRLVDDAELDDLLNSKKPPLIIDVRPSYEYQEAHLPGSLNLEFHLGHRNTLDTATRQAFLKLAGNDPDRRVIFYCRSFRCLRSDIAASWAVRLGFRNVWRYPGGYYGWLKHTGQASQAEPRGLKVGDIFPSCRLVVLQGQRDRAYLGLADGARAFALREVKADYLLVEFYSELCMGCLREVASYNLLFGLINQDPQVGGRLKMLGMGVGSLKREVAKFSRQKKVRFPLFADERQEVFACLGKPELPIAYLLAKKDGQGYRILMKHSGRVASPYDLLLQIKQVIAAANG